MSITEHKCDNPKIVLLLCGKRKSGKDYVANILLEKFGEKDCAIIRLSAPIKKQYAEDHNLDYNELLESSQYKEMFRFKMIEWSEKIREKDSGYFCRLAIEQANASEKSIWVISDARRESDVEYFRTYYPSITYVTRIYASPEIRISRGFEFTKGVDDAESECGLDYLKFDFRVRNDNEVELYEFLKQILDLIATKCRSEA